MKRARPDDDDEPPPRPAPAVRLEQTLPWDWLPPEMHLRVRMQLVPTAALALALTCTSEYSMPKGQWGVIARGIWSLRGAATFEPLLYRALGYTLDEKGERVCHTTEADMAWVRAHWREPGRDLDWMVARRGSYAFSNLLYNGILLSDEETIQWRAHRQLKYFFCKRCDQSFQAWAHTTSLPGFHPFVSITR